MNISPRRRQRALKVHELRQQGRSLRNIGKRLDISHATVLADLKLIETHWSEFTRQATDDMLLEQLGLLQRRLRSLLQQDLLDMFGSLSPPEFVRLHVAHNQELAILLRETRRLATQLHDRAEYRHPAPGQISEDLDYPLEELTAAAKPPSSAQKAASSEPAKADKPAKTGKLNKPRRLPETTNIHHGLPKGLPKSSKPNHSNHQIPRKTLEIPTPTTQAKNPNQPLTELTPKQLQKEAEIYLRNQNKQSLQTTAAGG